MSPKRGFHLIDCFLALFFLMVGLTAAVGLNIKSHQNLIRVREHTVAWSILTSVLRQPANRLAVCPQRYFDAWGRSTSQTEAIFTVDITALPWNHGVQFEVVLRYTDFDGYARRRVLSKYARSDSCEECL